MALEGDDDRKVIHKPCLAPGARYLGRMARVRDLALRMSVLHKTPWPVLNVYILSPINSARHTRHEHGYSKGLVGTTWPQH